MKVTILFLLFCIITDLSSQNFIGLHKDSIDIIIKTKEKDFKPDDFVVKKVYNYLKYVDGINQQTWLFFLDDNDICTSTKLMSDYMNYSEVTEKLNSQHKKNGDKEWEYTDKGKTYLISLKEGDWYFTLTTKQKE